MSNLDAVNDVEEQVMIRLTLHTSVASLLTGKSILISLDSFLLRLLCWFFLAGENERHVYADWALKILSSNR